MLDYEQFAHGPGKGHVEPTKIHFKIGYYWYILNFYYFVSITVLHTQSCNVREQGLIFDTIFSIEVDFILKKPSGYTIFNQRSLLMSENGRKPSSQNEKYHFRVILRNIYVLNIERHSFRMPTRYTKYSCMIVHNQVA